MTICWWNRKLIEFYWWASLNFPMTIKVCLHDSSTSIFTVCIFTIDSWIDARFVTIPLLFLLIKLGTISARFPIEFWDRCFILSIEAISFVLILHFIMISLGVEIIRDFYMKACLLITWLKLQAEFNLISFKWNHKNAGDDQWMQVITILICRPMA